MRQGLILMLCISFASNSCADCDFSKDIQKNADGSYTYTRECHLDVGNTYKALEKRVLQVGKLEEALELKDLALIKSHERMDLWRNTTYKLEDRVNSMEEFKKRNEWLYFGLGIVVTGLAVWGAGQLDR